MKYKFVKQLQVPMAILSSVLIGGVAYMIGGIQSTESQSKDIQIIYPDAIVAQIQDIEASPSPSSSSEAAINKPISSEKAMIVASKNGTRYYYSHCGGVNRIKPENKIYFQSKEEAEAKGLTLAATCKPL